MVNGFLSETRHVLWLDRCPGTPETSARRDIVSAATVALLPRLVSVIMDPSDPSTFSSLNGYFVGPCSQSGWHLRSCGMSHRMRSTSLCIPVDPLAYVRNCLVGQLASFDFLQKIVPCFM